MPTCDGDVTVVRRARTGSAGCSLPIAEMDWLIDDIAENGEVTTSAEAEARPVPTFTSDNVREDC